MKSVYDYLTERSSPISQKTMFNSVELVNASYDGELDTVIELLEQGADPESKEPRLGDTPITKWDGEEEKIIEELLKYGANINAQNKFGETVLHNLSHRLDSNIYEFLKSKGADKTILNSHKLSPSAFAFGDHNYDMLDDLKIDSSIKEIVSSNHSAYSFVKESSTYITFRADIDYIVDFYEQDSRDGVQADTLLTLCKGEIHNEDANYGMSWEDCWYDIDEENMKIIEEICAKEGWDSETDIKEFIEENSLELTSDIASACENAMRYEEEEYLDKQLKSHLDNASIEIDYDTQTFTVTCSKDELWDAIKEGLEEMSKDVLEGNAIDTIYYPRYGLGYDNKTFNELLKDYV